MKSCSLTIQTKPLLQNLCIVLQSKPALRTPIKDGHLIITDSFLCPLGKSLTFPLHSTYFKQTCTPLIQTFSLVHSVSILKASNCSYFFWIFNFCDFFALAYCGAYYSDIYLGHKVTGYINRIII